MNKQDNPHAKGLSVNEDWIGEDYSEIPVYNSPASMGHWPSGTKELLSESDWQKDIDEGRVSIVSPAKKAREDYFHSSILKGFLHQHENQRSGLALTNPEE